MTTNTFEMEQYLDFVQNRHAIWEARQYGESPPWTDDPVLRAKKFTNVFRFLDYGSQFLIRELLQYDDPTPEDALMRCFLYRYTNRPEPFLVFYNMESRYPVVDDLKHGLDGRLAQAWRTHKARGGKIFGPAYRMFVGKENAGMDRLSWVIMLTRSGFHPAGSRYITERWLAAETQELRFRILSELPRCKNFMSMQILTDAGYAGLTDGDRENEFVIAGPGARRGVKHVDPQADPVEMIHRMMPLAAQRAPLELPDGTVRVPSLMDVQNTFCEFSKYIRYRDNGVRPDGQYTAQHPGRQPIVVPSHWMEPKETTTDV